MTTHFRMTVTMLVAREMSSTGGAKKVGHFRVLLNLSVVFAFHFLFLAHDRIIKQKHVKLRVQQQNCRKQHKDNTPHYYLIMQFRQMGID